MESQSATTERSASALVAPSNERGRPHLAYLDGLRGLAALYVVLHHVVKVLPAPALPHGMAKLSSMLAYGHFAVNTFIVLSGYCLMLPFVTSGRKSLQGETIPFIRRRARRILPPYFAALLISLLLLPAIGSLSHGLASTPMDNSRPSAGSIVAHLLLVHNLSMGWIAQIDSPLWSVATEWQIYFVFILVLLPVCRIAGIFTAVAVAFAIGLLPHAVSHGRLDMACFWFTGSFALGMLGAHINYSKTARARRMSELPWLGFGVAIAVAVKLVLTRHAPWLEDPHHGWMVIDPLFAAAVMCLLIASTNTAHAAKPAGYLAAFTNRPAVTLGVFSYSLYLIHAPILCLAAALLRDAHVSPVTGAIVMFGVVVPLSIALAYLFHRAFERPFLRSSRKSREDLKPLHFASGALGVSAVKAEEVMR